MTRAASAIETNQKNFARGCAPEPHSLLYLALAPMSGRKELKIKVLRSGQPEADNATPEDRVVPEAIRGAADPGNAVPRAAAEDPVITFLFVQALPSIGAPR